MQNKTGIIVFIKAEKAIKLKLSIYDIIESCSNDACLDTVVTPDKSLKKGKMELYKKACRTFLKLFKRRQCSSCCGGILFYIVLQLRNMGLFF